MRVCQYLGGLYTISSSMLTPGFHLYKYTYDRGFDENFPRLDGHHT